MKKIGWFFRLSSPQPTLALIQRIAGCIGISLLMMAGVAAAQNPTPAAPFPAPAQQTVAPDGYTVHESLDLGGRMASIKGSGAMYDTLVNLHSGPRVLGESFEMRALPGNKHPLFDVLKAFSNGVGGDPNNFAKMDFSKGKLYEFTGVFRRDRQYFDYDLLGNPNIPGGQSIPVTGSTTPLAWPQVNQSSVLFNTVRRMTDTSLTILPLSKVTFRVAYSQNIFQGPSLSPSGYQFATGDAILAEYQRNSTDDFTGAIDWKPVRGTMLTFEEQIDHYKADSYFNLTPGSFIAQELDGTKVALNNYDSLTPLRDSCDTFAAASSPVFSAPQTSGGLPVISPFCSAVTNYTRTQPTRILYPTEIFRFQSSSIKNISMNGDFRYTNANMNLPNYYDSYQGLNETAVKTAGVTTGYYGVRSLSYTGNASAKREVVSADYGIVWQVMKTFSLSDQIDYSNVHQPGTADITSGITLKTPTDTAISSGNAGINYPTLITATAAIGASTFEGSPAIGTPMPAYFGQRFLTNNLTGSWDASSRATLSLTYRYRTHMIAENVFSAGPPVDPGGNPGNSPLAPGATTNGTVTINENGAIFNAAVRPANNWNVNGTVEVLYDDNAFTPVGPRQTKHYRVHTLYRPKPWVTITGAYNDLERHNNTNNNQATVALFTPPSASPAPNGTAAAGTPYEGPLQHVDYSRVFSVGTVLSPNEHYGLDLNYAYSEVYASTNICYLNGAAGAALPGAVQTATSTVCPNIFGRGATAATELSGAALEDWYAKDFMKAPTQYVSAALTASPVKSIHANLGYRISDVNGTRFFNDARDVNGSLVSKYQSPFVNLAWTIHPGWIVKADYNYYGYGEGGPSGSPFCSTATSIAAEAGIVPCTSSTLTGPTGLTEPSSGLTAPRNFHANNVTISMHYEF